MKFIYTFRSHQPTGYDYWICTPASPAQMLSKIYKIYRKTFSLYWFFCVSSGPYISCSTSKANLGNFLLPPARPTFFSPDLNMGFFLRGFCNSGTETLDMMSNASVPSVWVFGSIDC